MPRLHCFESIQKGARGKIENLQDVELKFCLEHPLQRQTALNPPRHQPTQLLVLVCLNKSCPIWIKIQYFIGEFKTTA